jgi:hypothetical protein
MILGIWTESTVSEWIANLRREAAHERLLRSGGHGGRAQHGGSVPWRGWAGRVRLRRRSSWPGPALLTQRGDRS